MGIQFSRISLFLKSAILLIHAFDDEDDDNLKMIDAKIDK